MPPKKKKSGKKGKKSAKKSGRGSPSKSIETMNELSKEYFIIQIRDLENRLHRYQKRCDELEVNRGNNNEKFEQLEKQKNDIVDYLKKEINKKNDDIEDLNEQLIGLQQTRELEKEQAHATIQQIKTELQETKDQLTSDNMILGGKLASLEEFKVHREELMAKFANMEKELKQKDEDHKSAIYDLEKKAVLDKSRLKSEMVQRVNQVAAEFRRVSNKQMAETTKNTIRENVSITAQLAKMSDKTMELIQENDELKKKEKQMKQHIEMLEDNEKTLAKKNHSHQKLIKMLTDKCRNQEALIAEFDSREQEYQELDAEIDFLKQQVESQREEIQNLAKENEQLEEDLKEATVKYSSEKRNKEKVDKILFDAAEAIKLMLKSDDTESEDGYNEIEKRDNMLENLLILLNSAAAIGVGPQPEEFGKYEMRQKSASEMPGSKQGIKRGTLPMSPVARSGGTLPHYQLGDLGLIPRPKNHIPTSVDKMRVLSATTRLGGLRKVLTKSVAVQTVSAPKALFYADQLLSKAPAGTQDAVIAMTTERIRSPGIPLGPIQTNKQMTSKVF
ncbi:cilia- and flagella-associated protein 157-like [Saccostrea echinata]|uniref:cilia- and flagella-associated protein 157-like n=1 Tax=Saccostrea echinata TaxID=191078 RepID=UPI002A83C1FF|nr:cilia- and flagella-associated protein 157-like [Saccostrea echinata]